MTAEDRSLKATRGDSGCRTSPRLLEQDSSVWPWDDWGCLWLGCPRFRDRTLNASPGGWSCHQSQPSLEHHLTNHGKEYVTCLFDRELSKAQGLILYCLFPRKYEIPAKTVFSRHSRFISEPAHPSVNYTHVSFLTLRALACTVISFRIPKLYLAYTEYPRRVHWLIVGNTLNKSLIIFSVIINDNTH